MEEASEMKNQIVHMIDSLFQFLTIK